MTKKRSDETADVITTDEQATIDQAANEARERREKRAKACGTKPVLDGGVVTLALAHNHGKLPADATDGLRAPRRVGVLATEIEGAAEVDAVAQREIYGDTPPKDDLGTGTMTEVLLKSGRSLFVLGSAHDVLALIA